MRNLANGAACTVTEPKTGGANAVAIAPSAFTVGANPATPTAVSVTNTFTVGALRVTKALAGEPAASLAAATGYEYEVSASCERPVDGVMQPFAGASADDWAYPLSVSLTTQTAPVGSPV